MGKTALHVLAKRSTPHFAVRDKEREREKRKKILKMCVQKLRDIDDPETVLCRAVLINNTFKTLKYTHRHIYRPEPEAEPVYEAASEEESEEEDDTTEDQDDDVSTDESSNSDDESVPTSSSDNESDIDNDSSSSVPILPADNAAATSSTYCQDELDNNFNSENYCDIKNFAATDSIVHSLMMPPLLSPQIEDITNCSFYDSFSNSNQDPTSLSDTNANKLVDNVGNSENEMTASFRFTVVDSNLDDSNTVNNGYTPPSDMDYCQKSCVQSDIGNSMLIDNLLTEIVQA